MGKGATVKLRKTLALPHLVSPSQAPAPIDLSSLRLDTALALLAQDEELHPPAPEGTTGYLQHLIDGLCELSLKDPLTGLANRRQFRAVLEREVDRVTRTGESALLLMLDIDHFKRVNDSHGHPAGDIVLQSVADTLANCVRPMDTLARYGGEEFAVVLPGCQAAFGRAVAERIRSIVESTPITIAPGLDINVTVSIGGSFTLPWVRSPISLWIERADHQLYRAKSEGRNRVCLDFPPDSTVSAEEKGLLFYDVQDQDQDERGISTEQSDPADSANRK
ncbi:MAG: GGDEF domain-containing protein [Curvibacter sp.]|nr:MAG: GGDEF domain-containing protein [Curvibacter sp.]